MGNQLATVGAGAANFDLSTVNPKVAMVTPLGRRRGRLFNSAHCRYGEERRDVVARLLLRAYGDAEQSLAVADQERIFAAVESAIRKARKSTEGDLRSPRPVHLLYYTQTKVTDRAVYLERPFIATSLADRLRQRPFLGHARRLFTVYQLFDAVRELHNDYGISHGDLKHENVLLNSAGWLYVTDLAPYKPTVIESFNPANFEFFFDCSETRVCTLAPERFRNADGEAEEEAVQKAVPSSGPSPAAAESVAVPQTAGEPSKRPYYSADGDGYSIRPVAEASEVFSAACIAVHILTDEPLFKLSNVLELRSKPTVEERRAYVMEILSGFPRVPEIEREFVADALVGFVPSGPAEDAIGVSSSSVDPSLPNAAHVRRLNAVDALKRYEGSVFPRYFGMLHVNVLPSLMSMPPDVTVHFLWTRIFDIVDSAIRCEWDASFASGMTRTSAQHREVVSSSNARHARSMSSSSPIGASSPTAPTTKPAGLKDTDCGDGYDDDEEDDNARYVTEKRRVQVQEDVLDIIAPVLANSMRFLLIEDTIVKAFRVVERIAALCSDDTRTDVLLPITISIVQSSKSAITPVVRAAALRALATICAFIRALPASESFLYEDYILPAVVAASKASPGKSMMIAHALADTVPVILRAALHILELRQGFGHRSRLDYDAQRDYLVNRCWELLKPLITNHTSSSSVIVSVLRHTKTLLPCLGIELVSDGFVSMLTQLLGSAAVEVKRAMYAAILEVALFLRHGIANASSMVFLMLDESLREKDARCVTIGIDSLQRMIDERVLTDDLDVLRLVQATTAHLAHPCAWVSRAAARLFATAARKLDPVDVQVRLAPAVKGLLQHPVPLAVLDRVDLSAVITPAARLAHANERRRLPCCADYLRTHNNPERVSIPPGVTATRLENAIRLDALDVTTAQVVWLVKALRLDGAASLAAHGRGEVKLPFLAKAPDTPWHMSQWHPTPRELKRALWQFKQHKRDVAASAKSKLRRGLNLKQVSNNDGPSLAQGLSAVVSAASKVRQPARPTGAPLATCATAHDGGVTAMTTAKQWVVTAGRDNLVRLWDAADVLKTPSSHLLLPQTVKTLFSTDILSSYVLCARFASDDPHSPLAFGDSMGRMRLFDIGASAAVATVKLDNGQCGGISACVPLDPKVFIVGSHRGGIYAVDTRTPSREAWMSHVPRNRGPISSMVTVSSDAACGIACATLRGYVGLFDMRFRAQMASTSLPQSPAIYDMASISSGPESSAPSIAVATSHFDVLRLNAGSFQETMAFKPAAANSVRCLCTSAKGTTLFTGGSDGLLRSWNLSQPEGSKTLTPPPARSFGYNFSRGAMTIAEVQPTAGMNASVASAQATSAAGGISGGVAMPTNHTDQISKLGCVTGPGGQHFLVSGGRDGALTVWRNAPAVAVAP
jgi:phosphoinositide-3-kinase regulatory subunit 4